ncbi:unnamed protein product [Lampetra planeri]
MATTIGISILIISILVISILVSRISAKQAPSGRHPRHERCHLRTQPRGGISAAAAVCGRGLCPWLRQAGSTRRWAERGPPPWLFIPQAPHRALRASFIGKDQKAEEAPSQGERSERGG